MDQSPRFRSLFHCQKLNSVGIPFLFSLFLLLLFPDFSPIPLVLLGAVLLLASVFVGAGERRDLFLLAAVGLSAAILFMGADGIRKSRLSSYHEKEIIGAGTVTSVNEDGFDLRLRAPFSAKLRVDTPTEAHLGDRVCLPVVLSDEVPTSLRTVGVDFVASATDEGSVIGRDPFYSFLGSLRENGVAFFGEGREGGFFRAVLLGDRSALDTRDQEAIRSTSSSHLLAISGLHVSLILGFLYRLLRLLCVPARVRGAIVLPVCLFILFLTGASVSVFRASLMAAFPILATLFLRRSDSVTCLVLAAVLLALWEPYALLSPSFLLSFSSTLGILLAAAPLSEALSRRFFDVGDKKRAKAFLRPMSDGVSSLIVASAVFVFQLPAQVLLFGQVEPFSPLYAWILIPLFAPCALAGLVAWMLSPIPYLGGLGLSAAKGIASLFLNFARLLGFGGESALSFGSLTPWVGLLLLGLTCALVLLRVRIVGVLYLHVLLAILLPSLSLVLRLL
ncbi:MAG: ComEC/Rec2 family competence protein [Clostridia bacterium]|nr:ComEC/Rec2 family competence protein [Clostridia bacterium]